MLIEQDMSSLKEFEAKLMQESRHKQQINAKAWIDQANLKYKEAEVEAMFNWKDYSFSLFTFPIENVFRQWSPILWNQVFCAASVFYQQQLFTLHSCFCFFDQSGVGIRRFIFDWLYHLVDAVENAKRVLIGRRKIARWCRCGFAWLDLFRFQGLQFNNCVVWFLSVLELLEPCFQPLVPLMERNVKLLHLLEQTFRADLVNVVVRLVLLGVNHL